MKSNKSINRRTHKNRLSLSRYTKRSNAKNVLKRSTKSQKVYRGGASRASKPSTPEECFGNYVVYDYTRDDANKNLIDAAEGTWMFRKSKTNIDNYVLSIKNNKGSQYDIVHIVINCEKGKIKIKDTTDDFMDVKAFITQNTDYALLEAYPGLMLRAEYKPKEEPLYALASQELFRPLPHKPQHPLPPLPPPLPPRD